MKKYIYKKLQTKIHNNQQVYIIFSNAESTGIYTPLQQTQLIMPINNALYALVLSGHELMS